MPSHMHDRAWLGERSIRASIAEGSGVPVVTERGRGNRTAYPNGSLPEACERVVDAPRADITVGKRDV